MRRLAPQWNVLPVAALLAVLSVRASSSLAADEAAAVALVDDIPAAVQLAAPATGQTLYVLDGASGGVTAVDPFQPPRRWTAIGPEALVARTAEEGGIARAVAIACIDSNTLALVLRSGKPGNWSVGTYRLAPPGSTQQAAVRLQTLPLGTSAAESEAVRLVVSPSREWLAVVGLPAPMPVIVRAPIAGSRIGTFAERRCPKVPPPGRPVGATISPGDEEWVLFLREDVGGKGPVFLSFYGNAGGRELLHLDTGLTVVRGAGYCRESGTLWTVGLRDEGSSRAAGLWRIDAILKDGRQAARGVHVAAIEDPLSVVCLSRRAIAVIAGGADRRVLLIDPTATAK